MRPNPFVQNIYRIHTKHIPKEAIHLGDAESLDDVVVVAEEISAQKFSLAKCCTDGSPTLQLANGNRVRRMRLSLLNDSQRSDAVKYLQQNGVYYKQTSYLPLNIDFSETDLCRKQERFKHIYRAAIKVGEVLNKLRF